MDNVTNQTNIDGWAIVGLVALVVALTLVALVAREMVLAQNNRYADQRPVASPEPSRLAVEWCTSAYHQDPDELNKWLTNRAKEGYTGLTWHVDGDNSGTHQLGSGVWVIMCKEDGGQL